MAKWLIVSDEGLGGEEVVQLTLRFGEMDELGRGLSFLPKSAFKDKLSAARMLAAVFAAGREMHSRPKRPS